MVAEEMRADVEAKARRGLLVVLGLSFVAGMLGAGYAFYHVYEGTRTASQFALELSSLALLYIELMSWGFAVPVVLLLLALAVTVAGRKRRAIGVMLAALLFAFAVLWPAGAVVAFMSAYDPPRSTR
jgi:hypothetical protein